MATAAGSALRPQRTQFKNDLVLLHTRAAASPSVVVRALIRAGSSRETPSEHGIAGLTGRMLRQGTENIAKAALAEELDGMGAGLSVDVGYALVVISIKCLSGDFNRAMEILSELVRRPTFPVDELERLKGQILTDLKEMDDNTRVVSERTWRELAYPATHPYHRLTVGSAETVGSASRESLHAFHSAWYGPNQTTLMVVGDVTLDDATAAATRMFVDWHGARSERVESALPATDPPERQLRDVPMVGKTQADVTIGLPTLDRSSTDYYALNFANHILGRIYSMGRFGEKVRDDQSLAALVCQRSAGTQRETLLLPTAGRERAKRAGESVPNLQQRRAWLYEGYASSAPSSWKASACGCVTGRGSTGRWSMCQIHFRRATAWSADWLSG